MYSSAINKNVPIGKIIHKHDHSGHTQNQRKLSNKHPPRGSDLCVNSKVISRALNSWHGWPFDLWLGESPPPHKCGQSVAKEVSYFPVRVMNPRIFPPFLTNDIHIPLYSQKKVQRNSSQESNLYRLAGL